MIIIFSPRNYWRNNKRKKEFGHEEKGKNRRREEKL
jgi:hypothetical protein